MKVAWRVPPGTPDPPRYVEESLPPLGKTKVGGRYLGELRHLAVLPKQGFKTNLTGVRYSY